MRPCQLLGQVLKGPALANEITTGFLVKIQMASVGIICSYILTKRKLCNSRQKGIFKLNLKIDLGYTQILFLVNFCLCFKICVLPQTSGILQLWDSGTQCCAGIY